MVMSATKADWWHALPIKVGTGEVTGVKPAAGVFKEKRGVALVRDPTVGNAPGVTETAGVKLGKGVGETAMAVWVCCMAIWVLTNSMACV